mmetsp:Transcript_42102/g.61902  ORF Transcript_42102/g.61902 Transcript_42102/m.61902 type:complete len:269 (-) Transcript_42102:3456-4262(-)
MSFDSLYLTYRMASSVKMPAALPPMSLPNPLSSIEMSCSKKPLRSYTRISSSISSGIIMRLRPQICASLNSSCATHATSTSFHVRVKLALRAASTASAYFSSRTRQEASLSCLLMEEKSMRAASNRPISAHRSPTSSTLAMLGDDTNSSSSDTMLVRAYAINMAVSMTDRASCVPKSFLRAICKNVMSGKYWSAFCAASITLMYSDGSLALTYESMASDTEPFCNCAAASVLQVSSRLLAVAKSLARSRSPMFSSSTIIAAFLSSYFL